MLHALIQDLVYDILIVNVVTVLFACLCLYFMYFEINIKHKCILQCLGSLKNT